MALGPGSITFTGYEGDTAADHVSFVATETIPAGTQIYFTDKNWDGNTFAGGEQTWSWTATSAVPQGASVTLSNFNAGTPSASTGAFAFEASASGGFGRGLNVTDENIYAYTADSSTPGTPEKFLAALATRDFSSVSGTLDNTGLTQGETALNLQFAAGADIAEYNGPSTFDSVADGLAALNDPANWVRESGVGDQSNNGTQPDLPLPTQDFVFCFAAGTMIATPSGDVAVERLAIGDLVTTGDGRQVPVRWMGRQTFTSLFGVAEGRRPVKISAGALGSGLPKRELCITSDHALLIDDVLVQAGALVNGTTIRRLTNADLTERFTVYHIETENHEIVLAEGTPAETFIDNVARERFDNYAEFEAMFGHEPQFMLELDQPRAKSQRQVPKHIKERVAAVAAERQARGAVTAFTFPAIIVVHRKSPSSRARGSCWSTLSKSAQI